MEPDATPGPADDGGYVQIRMAGTIDEFTYGNPHQSIKLEAGKMYRVPVRHRLVPPRLGEAVQRRMSEETPWLGHRCSTVGSSSPTPGCDRTAPGGT